MASADPTTQALRLLELLTAAPGQQRSRAQVTRALECTESELDGYLELISTLADRTSGVRAVILSDGDSLRIMGDAAKLRLLRLSMGESVSLSYVLDALNIESEQRARIAAALLPPGFSADTQDFLAVTPSFGSHRAQLTEAIQDGVRCRVLYRAHEDHRPHERLVDPIEITVEAGIAYLVAWNVVKDEERRYRLDRITAVSFTDDSVAPHTSAHNSIHESLRRAGELVTLVMPDETAAQLAWAGIESREPAPGAPGYTQLTVRASSRAWLFDQVLAEGGNIAIASPQPLVDELRAYAMQLLEDS